MQSLAHEFDHLKRTTITQHVFTHTSSSRRPDIIIYIKPAADDRRVTDAARKFVSQATGRTAARNVSVLTQHQQRNGVVCLGWLGRLVLRIALALTPIGVLLLRIHFDRFYSI